MLDVRVDVRCYDRCLMLDVLSDSNRPLSASKFT